MKRRICLSDGDGMGDSLIIFETNVPEEMLRGLELASIRYIVENNLSTSEVPNWMDKMNSMGYVFNYIADHPHISPYASSAQWKKTEYQDVTEEYSITNDLDILSKIKTTATSEIEKYAEQFLNEFKN